MKGDVIRGGRESTNTQQGDLAEVLSMASERANQICYSQVVHKFDVIPARHS